MFTPKSIDELQAALRVLDDAGRSIDELLQGAVAPERPAIDCHPAKFDDYRLGTSEYFGQKAGLESALFVLQGYRKAIAWGWDQRHIHAPAQLAADRLKGQR